MEKLFNKMPLWIINAISFVSGILTIAAAVLSLFSLYNDWNKEYIIIFIVLCLFIVLLIIRMRKYQKIAFDRQQITSFVYHKLTHISRDLYFDIMRCHKDKTESIRNMTEAYQNQLSVLLTHLCDMMEKYCGQKIDSCIKLITRPEADIKDIMMLYTFS